MLKKSNYKKDWRLYYLTTARIPGEKAHSLQTIKNVDELKSQGCDIKLLAAKRKNDFKVKESIEKHFHLKNQFKIKYIPTFSHLTSNKKLRDFFFLLLNISFSISCFVYLLLEKTEKKKLIFIRDTSLLKHIINLMKLKKYTIIFELHDLPKPKNVFRKIDLYRKCDIIFTTSNYQRDFLLKYGVNEKKVVYLRNGYDPNLFENISSLKINLKTNLSIPQNAKIVMYSGSLASWKSVDFILESAYYTNQNIYYIIIGGSEDEIGLLKKKFSEQLNKIKFLGYIPHNKIPQYLNEADILVQYTSAGGGELGSFSPIKILEYMAVGKAIVAVNEPWIKEILTDHNNGLLYQPNSPKDLGKKIMYLANNENFLKKIGEKAQEDVKPFSYPNRANKIISTIERLLELEK